MIYQQPPPHSSSLARAQAKDLTQDEPLALDPGEAAPAVLSAPAAAVQVEATGAEEGTVAAAPKKKSFIKVRTDADTFTSYIIKLTIVCRAELQNCIT